MTLLLAVALAFQSGCAKCHEKELHAEQGGVHAGAACTDCHGGDAKAAEKEPAHAGMASRSRARVPAMCARCHSDVRLMNPFGLPTDQHAHYLTSKHGEALARGVTDAAVCTDCHGVHGMRRAGDPTSPVHRSNVPATCGRCHSDEALMRKHSLAWDAEAKYRDGVHGRLLASGDAAAPTCASCHGNHGAVPPGFSVVDQVCGKCHVRQRELFEASPHAFYAKDGSFKGCAVCHGNHAIVSSAAEAITRCAPCHEEKDVEVAKARALWSVLRESRGRVERAAARVERLARAGIHTEDEQLLVEQARTLQLQLAPLQHALDAARVKEVDDKLAAALADIDARLDAKERGDRAKKWALAPIWLFLVTMAALFVVKRREVQRRGG